MMPKHYNAAINKCNIFINIGAYNGGDCIRMTENFPSVIAHAIEPCPTNFAVIQNKTKGLSRIKCHNVAITNQNGLIDFFISKHATSQGTSQANSLYNKFLEEKKWASKIKKVSVRGITMDCFCKENNIQNIGILKINCEGGEYKIFDTNDLEFINHCNLIDIQLHGKSSQFCSEEFVNKKKQIIKILKKSFILVDGSDDVNSCKHLKQIWSKK
jgi:FkbM family methyltransferase